MLHFSIYSIWGGEFWGECVRLFFEDIEVMLVFYSLTLRIKANAQSQAIYPAIKLKRWNTQGVAAQVILCKIQGGGLGEKVLHWAFHREGGIKKARSTTYDVEVVDSSRARPFGLFAVGAKGPRPSIGDRYLPKYNSLGCLPTSSGSPFRGGFFPV